MKTCARCGDEKPETEFGVLPNGRHTGKCRACYERRTPAQQEAFELRAARRAIRSMVYRETGWRMRFVPSAERG